VVCVCETSYVAITFEFLKTISGNTQRMHVLLSIAVEVLMCGVPYRLILRVWLVVAVPPA
jgi:hypothetical protein